jgi:predicted nucleotidyltransferase component of viral defense system
LETCQVDVGEGRSVVAPTVEEALRVKAYLVVQRNVVRDYLDVVALSDHVGLDVSVQVLLQIDAFYVDRSGEDASVLTGLVVALADPSPRDTEVISELPRYKGLAPQWHDWSAVVAASQELALRLGGAV